MTAVQYGAHPETMAALASYGIDGSKIAVEGFSPQGYNRFVLTEDGRKRVINPESNRLLFEWVPFNTPAIGKKIFKIFQSETRI